MVENPPWSMTGLCETSDTVRRMPTCFEIEPIMSNEAEEDGILDGVAQYYWSAILKFRPGSLTRPPTFCLLKAHCAPIMQSLQGRRTDESPYSPFLTSVDGAYIGQSWRQLIVTFDSSPNLLWNARSYLVAPRWTLSSSFAPRALLPSS
jgi:hypothetical protein